MTDFLAVKRKEIQDRLRELRPLVDEYQQLEAAAQALEGVGGNGTRRRRGGGSAATARRGGTRGRRGRRRGNTRGTQALELVKKQPGITIAQLADKMGIKQNYLYRVLPGLESDGLVKRVGKGWHPK